MNDPPHVCAPVAVDSATCEQPDELIQRAWDAGVHKKTVIREGIDAATFLLADDRDELATLFWPVPGPLEAVSRWAESPRSVARISEGLRPFASAVVPGCIVGAIVAESLVVPPLSAENATCARTLVIVASIAAIGIVLEVMIDATLKRRAARLDDETALAIVLAQLRRAMTRNAALVPHAVTWLRRGLAQAAAAAT